MFQRTIERADAAAGVVGRSLLRRGAPLAVAIGALTLLAWLVGPEAVVRVRAVWPVTTPLTAIALVLAGTAVELRRRSGPEPSRLARRLGVATAAIGAGIVVARLAPLPDRVLSALWLPNLDVWQPGNPNPALPPLLTGLIVLAVGQAIALSDRAPGRIRLVSRIGGVLSWVALAVVLLGYYGAETGGLPWTAAPDVALPVAVGFALLWLPLAQFTVVADLTARFGSSATTHLLLKRIGPMLVLAPLLLRGIGQLAEMLRAGPAPAAALADLAVVVLLGGALVAVGRAVDASNAERARSSALMQGVLGALHEGLIVRDADGRLVVANPAADDMVGIRFADVPDSATMIAAGDLRDEGGMPVAVEDLPSTNVRRTGRAVIGTVFQLRGDPDQPMWVRTNCVPFEDAGGRTGTVSTFSDITFDHEMSLALSQAEERFRLAFEQAPIGIAIVRPDGTFEDANPALCAVLDRPHHELIETSFQELTHPDDLELDLANLADLIAGRSESYQMDKRYLRPDGSVIWTSLHVSVLRDHEGAVQRFLSQVVDLTDRKVLELQLAHAASHDPLTGLPNRRLVEDRLTVALAAARRDGRAVATLFCDLDGFKAVNDTHGHAIGDALLTVVAERLRQVGREVDTVGRMGGDEFVVVAGGITDTADAARLAVRVRQAVEEPIRVDDVLLHPRVSVGLHLADGHGTAEEALSGADRRMYELKTSRQPATSPTAV